MHDFSRIDGEELVVLVDDDGRELGTATKSDVHHDATPLHLGFSCYVFDADGLVLMTRRALGKRTWPGVWTNSFCGHPGPGEAISAAVHRRARQELGLTIDFLTCVLPDFRYRAIAADGTVENELCPVFCAVATGPVRPSADEVMDHDWVSWGAVRSAAELRWAISPWAADQIPLLEAAIHEDRGQSSSVNSAMPIRGCHRRAVAPPRCTSDRLSFSSVSSHFSSSPAVMLTVSRNSCQVSSSAIVSLRST